MGGGRVNAGASGSSGRFLVHFSQFFACLGFFGHILGHLGFFIDFFRFWNDFALFQEGFGRGFWSVASLIFRVFCENCDFV